MSRRENLTARLIRGNGILVGLLFGFLLAFWGYFLAGAGDGSYLLIGLASSPMALFGIVPALFGPLLIWPVLFQLASGSAPVRSVLFKLAISVHVVTIPLVLLRDPYSDWSLTAKTIGAIGWFPVLIGAALYLTVQAVAWARFLTWGKRPNSQLEPKR